MRTYEGYRYVRSIGGCLALLPLTPIDVHPFSDEGCDGGGGLKEVLVEAHGLGDGVACAHVRLGRNLPTHRLCHLAIRY